MTLTPTELTDKNLFAYCDNNPITRADQGGHFWWDLVSLAQSIYEVIKDPTDPWNWVGLAGDILDLAPGVTHCGETVRFVKGIDKADDIVDTVKVVSKADNVVDTVQIAKAVDFNVETTDIIKTLDRSSGFTKSTASAGIQIHKGYKVGDGFNAEWKEYNRIKGVRPDYVDFDNKIIYELKPMNPRSIQSGVRQLQKYNKALGGGYTMRLELY